METINTRAITTKIKSKKYIYPPDFEERKQKFHDQCDGLRQYYNNELELLYLAWQEEIDMMIYANRDYFNQQPCRSIKRLFEDVIDSYFERFIFKYPRPLFAGFKILLFFLFSTRPSLYIK